MLNLGVLFWGSSDKDKEEKKSFTKVCPGCKQLSHFEWNGNKYECQNWDCGHEISG